jgi:phage gp16-like protein
MTAEPIITEKTKRIPRRVAIVKLVIAWKESKVVEIKAASGPEGKPSVSRMGSLFQWCDG